MIHSASRTLIYRAKKFGYRCPKNLKKKSILLGAPIQNHAGLENFFKPDKLILRGLTHACSKVHAAEIGSAFHTQQK